MASNHLFVIEDERHSEQVGRFGTWSAAMVELERLSRLPWDTAPNRCPCTNWRRCGRQYEIIEYDTSGIPWRAISAVPVLGVSDAGVVWRNAGEP